MKLLNKNNILVSLVILLLLANTATLVNYWMKRPKGPKAPPPAQPSQYLINTLKLDKGQQEKYLALVKEHQEASMPLLKQLKASKDSMFQLIGQNDISDSLVMKAANQAGKVMEELDLLTFRHFREVRKICNPGQQEIFDNIIQDMLSMMGPRGRPGGPGGPGRKAGPDGPGMEGHDGGPDRLPDGPPPMGE